MRRQPPRHVAVGGLDLDHLRTKIAEDLGGVGTRQKLGEVENAQMR
jgi:hypothetical protein